MTKLRDGTAIVTGAGGAGCGRAIALRLAREGAIVVAADIDEAGGHETVQLIGKAGGRALFNKADVRSEQQVRDLVEFGVKASGRLAVLVNNASAPFRPDEPLDHWADAVQTDLLGPMYSTRAAIDAMRRSGGGSIVNIASISALWHGRRFERASAPAYDTAKAGLIRLTTTLASLAKSDGIHVNCLALGWIDTEGPRQYWESLTPARRLELGVPSRLLRTCDVADAVVRLATDEALAGRVVVWWSEDAPRLIPWGDRGYRELEEF
jgi:NAD(P)-dependent dehydrogenase (short-subunit alcohol dehydrogenase family)